MNKRANSDLSKRQAQSTHTAQTARLEATDTQRSASRLAQSAQTGSRIGAFTRGKGSGGVGHHVSLFAGESGALDGDPASQVGEVLYISSLNHAICLSREAHLLGTHALAQPGERLGVLQVAVERGVGVVVGGCRGRRGRRLRGEGSVVRLAREPQPVLLGYLGILGGEGGGGGGGGGVRRREERGQRGAAAERRGSAAKLGGVGSGSLHRLALLVGENQAALRLLLGDGGGGEAAAAAKLGGVGSGSLHRLALLVGENQATLLRMDGGGGGGGEGIGEGGGDGGGGRAEGLLGSERSLLLPRAKRMLERATNTV